MEEIAQVYARSLFEVIRDADVLDEVRDQLGEFVDALNSNRELAVFFFSPYFSPTEKKDGLARAVSGANPLLSNFLGLLIDKHRVPTIFRIRRELDSLWEQERKRLPVELTSAIELPPELVERIGTRIGESTGRRVALASRVDPDILGGVVLRVGNAILDASIRARLEQLRKQVAQAA